MRRRILILFLLCKIVNLGVSFQAGTKAVVPMPHFSPNRPRELNRVNDNYHVVDPLDSHFCSVQGLEVMNQTVNCNVVSHAHFVTDSGLSQKRDLSPDWKENSIKFVKDVCFASHCLSAPPVSNVHNVAEKHPVGGCLQKFGRYGCH